MTARIGAISFQKLPLVRRAYRTTIDEERAGPLVCFFGRVGRQAKNSQLPLQKAIHGRRLSFVDGGAHCIGKYRYRGREVQFGITRGQILANRAF